MVKFFVDSSFRRVLSRYGVVLVGGYIGRGHDSLLEALPVEFPVVRFRDQWAGGLAVKGWDIPVRLWIAYRVHVFGHVVCLIDWREQSGLSGAFLAVFPLCH